MEFSYKALKQYFLFCSIMILSSSCILKHGIIVKTTPSKLLSNTATDSSVGTAIDISNLVVSNRVVGGMTVTIDFTGDVENNSTVYLYYCNDTDSPSCSPEFGIQVPMVRSGSTFSAVISGLVSPYDQGDLLNLSVVASDVDGVTGSPLIASQVAAELIGINTISDQSFRVGAAASINASDVTTGTDVTNGNTSITYTCYYDQGVDGAVASTASCSSLFGLTFSSSTGVLNWAVPSDYEGNYEFKIVASASTISDDEIFVLTVTGPTKIYRSVGATTIPLDSNSYSGSTNYMTISTSSVATFSIPIVNNVGVGDVVLIDSNSDGSFDLVHFIHERLSSTSYLLRDATGVAVSSTPAPNSSWRIYRAYTTIQNAENGVESSGIPMEMRNFDTFTNGKNISGAAGGVDQQWHIALYNDAIYTLNASVEVSSHWVTTSDNYLKFYVPSLSSEVGVSQKHTGTYASGGVLMDIQADNDYDRAFRISTGNVWVDGVRISLSNNNFGFNNAFSVDGGLSGSFWASNLIIKGNYSSVGSMGGVGIGSSALNVYLWNNIIYDIAFSAFNSSAISFGGTHTGHSYVFNNTVTGSNQGLFPATPTTKIVSAFNNNIAFNSNDTRSPENLADESHSNFTSQADVFGINSLQNKISSDFDFIDESGDNFCIDPTSISYHSGFDLRAHSVLGNKRYHTDIKGISRGSTWSVGACQ